MIVTSGVEVVKRLSFPAGLFSFELFRTVAVGVFIPWLFTFEEIDDEDDGCSLIDALRALISILELWTGLCSPLRAVVILVLNEAGTSVFYRNHSI